MKLMKNLWILLLVPCIFTGCKDDDTPEKFEGRDNYIASFSLTKDGITYDAAISRNRITVTVPYNVSLEGATARCEMAENASIQPDPSTIVQWELERQFLVTSFNQADRTYFYTVEYSDIVSSGSVTLDTQHEVDGFAATGISAIDGNLTIGSRESDDPIKNLNGLSNVVSVGNNLTIGAAYKGEGLATGQTGLANLKEVRGNLTLSENNNTLTDFSLPSLRIVTGNMTLIAKTLQTVEMPALDRVGGTLEIRSDALLHMTADLLRQVDGDMILAGSTTSRANTTCDYFYFPELKTVTGTLTLAYFGILANTGIIFPELTEAGGVTYEALATANAFTFPKAERFGDITLNNCPTMTELSMPELVTAGSLVFNSTTLIRKIECPELTVFSGQLHLDRLVSFTSLKTAFPKLAHIEGDLYMSNLSALDETFDLSGYTFGPASVITLQAKTLSNLKTLKGPDTFDGGLYINGAELTPLPQTFPIELIGFKNIRACHISGFTALAELSLPLVTCDDLTLENCGSASATGFRLDMPALTEVRGTLRCRTLGKPDSGSSANFPVLTTIGKQLSMYTNASYLSQINFPELKSVGNGGPVSDEAADDFALQLMPVGCVDGFTLPKLQIVKGNALFSSWTAAMTKVPGIACPALAAIEGNLEIGHASYTSSATTGLDFHLLTKAKSVKIGNLTSLTDFSTFYALIPRLSDDTWNVTGCGENPTYQQMKSGKTGAE